jgi:phosphoribosylamine---glycine ligase
MSPSKVKVLLVGSGGREHALAWKLLQSPLLDRLYVAPGNPGTEDYNIAISATDVTGLTRFAKEKKCFTIIGPENPLELGLVDSLEREGLSCFGPTQEQARLETSKSFAKEFMKSNLIPTASFEIFSDYISAFDYCKSKNGNVVIKVDGLAAGKGVFVCSDLQESAGALKGIFIDQLFGKSGNSVVVEEKLAGQEVSFMAICDGRTALPFGTATDHKRLLDGDKGPNTGGMGAYSPARGFGENEKHDVMERIVLPTVEKTGFRGFLYAGLMLTERGAQVLEFNVRLGDPETQALLPRLSSDLLQILIQTSLNGLGTLDFEDLDWSPKHSCCVIMCSSGYPTNVLAGSSIDGVEEAQKIADVLVFHAGTKRDGEHLLTNSGRVLCLTGCGSSLADASAAAYSAVSLISWKGENHRSDIGRPVPT